MGPSRSTHTVWHVFLLALLVGGCEEGISIDAAIPEAGGLPDTLPDEGGWAFDGVADLHHDLSVDLPVQPQDSFCRGWQDCIGADVCDLALGRCERRETLPATAMEIFAIKPPAAASGDRLVIDGQRFYVGIWDMLFIKVAIGAAEVSYFQMEADENRIVIPLAAGMTGPVKVTGSGATATSKDALKAAPGSGTLACDSSVPKASALPGKDVTRAGAYAAAYVDHPPFEARITYPAQCGSLRRPAVQGTYPLVVLLHGDGATYLNYEYLAQFLATWGFVSVMPAASDPAKIKPVIDQMRGIDLGTIAPQAKGVLTTSKVALVGHSKGSSRLQTLVADPALWSATVASVFLGPVDDGTKVPGHFMVLGATGDKQSGPAYVDAAYARQPSPKWKVTILGGNHSLFTDHKVWFGPLFDDAPTITRTDQITTVTSFVLPLLERAFGSTEHFPGQLDAPPASSLYSVVFAK